MRYIKLFEDFDDSDLGFEVDNEIGYEKLMEYPNAEEILKFLEYLFGTVRNKHQVVTRSGSDAGPGEGWEYDDGYWYHNGEEVLFSLDVLDRVIVNRTNLINLFKLFSLSGVSASQMNKDMIPILNWYIGMVYGKPVSAYYDKSQEFFEYVGKYIGKKPGFKSKFAAMKLALKNIWSND